MPENFNITLDYAELEKNASIIDEVHATLAQRIMPQITRISEDINSDVEGLGFQAYHNQIVSYNSICVNGVGNFCAQLSSIIRSTIQATDDDDSATATAVNEAFSG